MSFDLKNLFQSNFTIFLNIYVILHEDVLRFLYFLFFIFFLFIHLSFINRLILKKEQKRDVLVISHFKERTISKKILLFPNTVFIWTSWMAFFSQSFYIKFLGAWGGGSEQVTSLSCPIALLAHVLLASASEHFLDQLTLGRIYEGGGTSPIRCSSLFAIGKTDSVKLKTSLLIFFFNIFFFFLVYLGFTF